MAMLLAVVMIVGLMAPALATDGPVWSVEFDKNAKAVVVTVDGVKASFTNWKNNQADEYTVNGYVVSVTVKGNAIDKKALVGPVSPPAAPPPADVPAGSPSPTPSNTQIVTGTDTRFWRDGFGFHCNATNGNGRTNVTINGKVYKSNDQNDNGKDSAMHSNLVRVGTTTLWNLLKDDIVCATCGSTEWVTYSNNSGVINGKNPQVHHRAYAEIVKTWADENPNDLVAVFDIYKYDSKNKVDGRGALVIEGAEAGVKYQLEPGTYVVAERAKEGYLPQDDQRITVQEGKTTAVYFTNVPDNGGEDGSFSFEKKVEGENISTWLMRKFDNDTAKLFDILDGLEFYLINDENDYGPATPDPNGKVLFEEIAYGTYTLSEEITGAAVGVFVAMEPITGIKIDKDGVSVVVDGSYYSFGGGSSSGSSDIDDVRITWEKALPLIALQTDGTAIGQSIGYYFPYGTDVVPYNMSSYYLEALMNGEWVPSFCGRLFTNDPAGAYIEDSSYLTPEQKVKMIAALDFVNDTFGFEMASGYGINVGIEEVGYAVAQVLVWRIIHEEDIEAIVPAGWLLYAAQDPYYAEGDFDVYVDLILEKCIDIYNAKDEGASRITDVLSFTNENVLSQPQIVPVFGGGFWVENEPDEGEETATFRFEKKVEGENIVVWLAAKFDLDLLDPDDYATIMAILDGLVFTLSGGPGGPYTASPDQFGMVAFEKIVPGTYTLSEAITGAAVGKFKPMKPIEITLADKDDKIFVVGGVLHGVIEGASFGIDDRFTVVNGYTLPKHSDGLGYPGLNNGGDLFYIGVTHVDTGVEYASFCAHGGSRNFAGPGQSNAGCSGYLVVQRADMGGLDNDEMDTSYEAMLSALNWIHDNVGDLRLQDGPYGLVTHQRVVAQTVIWALLKNIEVESAAFASTNLTAEERKAVLDALDAAEAGYFGDILDLVYMVCDKHHDFETCQPQLVPIFGTFYVENEPEEGGEDGGVKFNKLVYGGSLGEYFVATGVELQFSFDLFRLVDDEYVLADDVGENGRFYAEAVSLGAVSVERLKPGNYVFKEVAGSGGFFLNSNEDNPEVNGTWGLVWNAIYPCDGCEDCPGGDGLYFTMPANGADAVWPECYELDAVGAPSVNNVFYCKHHVFWTVHEYQGAFIKQIPIDDGAGGYINFMNPETFAGYCGENAQFAVFPATCTREARFSLACGCKATETGGSVGEPLGHDIDYSNPTPIYAKDNVSVAGFIVYGCGRSSCDDIYSEGANETVYDLELWQELTGIECVDCWLAGAPRCFCETIEQFETPLAAFGFFFENDVELDDDVIIVEDEDEDEDEDDETEFVEVEDEDEDEDDGTEVVVEEGGEEEDEVAED